MNFKKVTFLFISLISIMMLLWYLDKIPFWPLIIVIILYLWKLVDGAIFIERNFYVRSINSLADVQIQKNDQAQKKICLSFDDGIDPNLTPKVLDILKAYDVKAMFFLIGKNIAGNENVMKRVHEEGHIIGNHSFSHGIWFDLQSSAKMLLDIENMNNTVKEKIGIIPIHFRPPYGVTNPNLAKAIERSALVSVGWNLRSMDTVAKSKSQLLNKLKDETKADSIILLHDRCPITVDTLTDYIVFCKQQGYTFVTL